MSEEPEKSETSKKPKRPRGRPFGSSPVCKIRRDVVEKFPELIPIAFEAAKAGDMTAFKELRTLGFAPLKPETASRPVDLDAKGGWLALGQKIVTLISSGSVAIDEGATLIGACANLARLEDLTDIRQRLERLESGGKK